MPAPPEFLHTGCKVGIIEILHKSEAEDAPKPDGHIGIARKIVIDLQRIEHSPRPCHRRGRIVRGKAEYLIRRQRKRIGEQHFFGKAI